MDLDAARSLPRSAVRSNPWLERRANFTQLGRRVRVFYLGLARQPRSASGLTIAGTDARGVFDWSRRKGDVDKMP
jgi:hypothetical protein